MCREPFDFVAEARMALWCAKAAVKRGAVEPAIDFRNQFGYICYDIYSRFTFSLANQLHRI
jgi:hypothetical protein